jgi:hypothetical protein
MGNDGPTANVAILFWPVGLPGALTAPGGNDHSRDPAHCFRCRNVGSLSHGGGLVAGGREGQPFQRARANVTCLCIASFPEIV